jgi:hypothetical protein
MLKELFQGPADLADTDWRDDRAYQDAKAAEDAAIEKASTLDAEYRRLSIDANQGSELIRVPPAGHPVHAVQYQANQADQAVKWASRARETAEDAAKRAVQAVGEEARRAAWPGVEAAIDQLSIQLNAFHVVQTQVFDRTDVRPVEIGNAVGLNEGDLKTFCSNVRTELGLSRS